MKVLIQSGSGIGSLVKQTVFAEAVREEYANAVIDIIVAGSSGTENISKEILSNQKSINNIYWYNSHDIGHDFQLIRLLRKKRYDLGIITIEDLLARKSSWIFRIMKIIGCKKLVGSGENRLDINLDIPPRTHYFDRINMYLTAVGLKAIKNYNTLQPALDSPCINKLTENAPSGKTVALIVGAKKMASKKNGVGAIYDVKSWGLQNWFQLAEKLVEVGINVVLVGGKSERNELNISHISVPDNGLIHDYIGKTTISESLSLLAFADLVIGGEGGMIHCAAAIGTSTLTVFGGTDYKVFAPRGGRKAEVIYSDISCYPCYGSKEAVLCRSHECLNNISIDKVFSLATKLLDVQL